MKQLLIILSIGLFLNVSAQNNIYLADPTIICGDNTYYMYGTEKPPQKGFPVLQSEDLVNWQTAPRAKNGYALKMGEQAFGTWGFWAPQILKYNDKFYMLYTADENIAIAESSQPAGPFTQKEQVALKASTRQIDPFLFVDNDGKIYLYHVRLHEGNTIWVAEFKQDLSGIKEETLKQCITATEPWEDTPLFESAPIIEGPTVIKRDGIYYLFYSANHFQNIDYAVGYAVSDSPLGPWKKADHSPIIDRHVIGRNGTGHGDLFQDKNGNWKYVFHVHYNDSVVAPRQTLIVDVKFQKDEKLGYEKVTIDKNKLYVPKSID